MAAPRGTGVPEANPGGTTARTGTGSTDDPTRIPIRKAEVAESVQDTAREVKEKTRDTAQQVKDSAREKVHEVRDRAQEKAEEQKTVAAGKAHAIARALREAGDALDRDGEPELARYGRSGADQIERLAGYLDRSDIGGLVSDLQQNARNNPGAFVGTTFAAGMLLGRFLRSSTPEPDHPASMPIEDEVLPGTTAIATDPIVPPIRTTTAPYAAAPRPTDTGIRRTGPGPEVHHG